MSFSILLGCETILLCHRLRTIGEDVMVSFLRFEMAELSCLKVKSLGGAETSVISFILRQLDISGKN